jgi:TRAP-type C4-dicarboxylate transport system permease large subunit
LVFLVVVVGIYGGWADPTEAAAFGAAATGALAVRNGLRWVGFKASVIGTASSTAMIFLVLLGADVLNTGLALTQMPVQLALWVQNSGLPPLLVLSTIIVIYVLLGCVMDSA